MNIKKIMLWTLSIIFIIGVCALWAGVFWVLAWLVDHTIDSATVNYTAFVLVGMGLFLLLFLFVVVTNLWARHDTNKFKVKI